MQNAIATLWEMYLEVKRGRLTDALDIMEKRYELTDEKEKLHIDLRNAQYELNKDVEEKHVTLAHTTSFFFPLPGNTHAWRRSRLHCPCTSPCPLL
jgi:hypothetical protein